MGDLPDTTPTTTARLYTALGVVDDTLNGNIQTGKGLETIRRLLQAAIDDLEAKDG